jgi:hypothetical protein
MVSSVDVDIRAVITSMFACWHGSEVRIITRVIHVIWEANKSPPTREFYLSSNMVIPTYSLCVRICSDWKYYSVLWKPHSEKSINMLYTCDLY